MGEYVIHRTQPLGLSGIPFLSEQFLNQSGLPKLHRLLHITGTPECLPPSDSFHGGKPTIQSIGAFIIGSFMFDPVGIFKKSLKVQSCEVCRVVTDYM